MTIKVLGTGCDKCKKLEKHTRQAVAELGLEATVEKVEDIGKIIGYGVMQTPALVVDEKVISAGKLLTVEEVKAILS